MHPVEKWDQRWVVDSFSEISYQSAEKVHTCDPWTVNRQNSWVDNHRYGSHEPVSAEFARAVPCIFGEDIPEDGWKLFHGRRLQKWGDQTASRGTQTVQGGYGQNEGKDEQNGEILCQGKVEKV